MPDYCRTRTDKIGDSFYTAQHVTDAYQKECAKNANQPYRSRDKGARQIAPCPQFLSAIK